MLASWWGLELEAKTYEVALLLLVLSLVLYARILKRLLALTGRTVWAWLPLIGALFLSISLFLHGFVQVGLMPSLGGDPGVYRQVMVLRSLSILANLGAGVLSLVAGLACYLSMGED